MRYAPGPRRVRRRETVLDSRGTRDRRLGDEPLGGTRSWDFSTICSAVRWVGALVSRGVSVPPRARPRPAVAGPTTILPPPPGASPWPQIRGGGGRPPGAGPAGSPGPRPARAPRPLA